MAATVLISVIPYVQDVFSMVLLNGREWGCPRPLAVPMIVDEATKFVYRRTGSERAQSGACTEPTAHIPTLFQRRGSRVSGGGWAVSRCRWRGWKRCDRVTVWSGAAFVESNAVHDNTAVAATAAVASSSSLIRHDRTRTDCTALTPKTWFCSMLFVVWNQSIR